MSILNFVVEIDCVLFLLTLTFLFHRVFVAIQRSSLLSTTIWTNGHSSVLILTYSFNSWDADVCNWLTYLLQRTAARMDDKTHRMNAA